MAGGWSIFSIKQTASLVEVRFGLKVALLNTSTKLGVDMPLFATRLKASLKLCYEVDYFQQFYETPAHKRSGLDNFSHLNNLPVPVYKRLRTYLDVQCRIIPKRITLCGEHLVEIKDGKDLPGRYAMVNKIYGSEIYVNANDLYAIMNGYDRSTLAHEFGHTLGLLHPDVNTSWLRVFGSESDQFLEPARQAEDPHNMMYSGASKYTHDSLSTRIAPDQMSIILRNIRNKAVNK